MEKPMNDALLNKLEALRSGLPVRYQEQVEDVAKLARLTVLRSCVIEKLNSGLLDLLNIATEAVGKDVRP